MQVRKLISSVLIFLFYYLSIAYCQVESYDLQFPYKGHLTEISMDDEGYLWMHDDLDFHRFNGHEIESVDIATIIDKKQHDYKMLNRIIFDQERIYFTHGRNIAIVNPQTREFENVWTIPDSYYLSYLYRDERGHLWVFAASWSNLERPVYKSEDGKNFQQVLDLNDVIGERSILWDFSELGDKDGTLYFQWRKGDLLIIDPSGKKIDLEVKDRVGYESTKSCSQFRLDNNKSLWRIYNYQFEVYNPKLKTFERHEISDKIEFLTQCKIDYATQNRETVSYDLGSFLNLKTIFEDREGRIWMACAASYLVCYDPSNDQMFNFRNEIVGALESGTDDIRKIIEDQDGNIWGINGGGLFKIKKLKEYFEKHLINTDDPEHNVYADKDVNPTLKKAFKRYNDYAYKNSTILTIEETAERDLIIQTDIFTYRLNKDKSTDVLPIFGPKESVFLSYNEKLKLYGVWNSYFKIEDDYQLVELQEPIMKVEDYLVQKNGSIWIAGLLNASNYLFGKINPDSYEFEGNYKSEVRDSSFMMNKVTSMTEDAEGNLLLGTTSGLSMLRNGDKNFEQVANRFYYKDDSISIGLCINQVEFLDNQDFWFLTNYEIGLANLKEKKIKYLEPLEEDWSTQEMNFLYDGDSAVWLANKDGIQYQNFLRNYKLNISKGKGLNTDQITILNLSRLSDNKIAVGTSNGLYLFHPDSMLISSKVLESKEKEYPLHFVSYSIIDSKKDSLIQNHFLNDETKGIELNYDDKMLTMDFSLINFNFPNDHSYSYKLEGYMPDWSNPSNDNSAVFTSLPPGDYVFKVKAKGTSGLWSNSEISIPLTVKEAWFRSYWFFGLSILFLGGLIYFITQYYFNQKIRRRKEIEKIRQNISHDLHDDVGTILAGLSMESELLSLDKNKKEEAALLKIAGSSREAMSRMRDIVWAMDSSRDMYENLIIRMKNFAQDQMHDIGVGYDFDVDSIAGKKFIKPDLRQNLYLIYKEAITNALKHSNGDKITISLVINDNDLLVLSIIDNGTYIDESKSEGIGLSSMKNRAERIGAKLEILTNAGYEVRVSLPV